MGRDAAGKGGVGGGASFPGDNSWKPDQSYNLIDNDLYTYVQELCTFQ